MSYQNQILHEFEHIGIISNNKIHKCHKHFSKEILLSSNPIKIKIRNKEFTTKGIIIEGDVLHEIDYTNKKALVVEIDCTTDFSRCLDILYLKGEEYCFIPQILLEKALYYLERNELIKIKELFYKEVFTDDIKAMIQHIKIKDERILKAINLIKTSESISPDIFEHISQELGLSKSRF